MAGCPARAPGALVVEQSAANQVFCPSGPDARCQHPGEKHLDLGVDQIGRGAKKAGARHAAVCGGARLPASTS